MKHDNICGDFHFNVDLSSNVKATGFPGIMESFNFVQLVSDPTNNHGHTLDLVFMFGLTIPSLAVVEMGIICVSGFPPCFILFPNLNYLLFTHTP